MDQILKIKSIRWKKNTIRWLKKTDYATEIANIINDYVTNAALNARHKDLIQKTKFNTEVKKLMIRFLQTVQNY